MTWTAGFYEHEETPMAETPPAEAEYVVVVNGEEQYSIWPAKRDIPSGWTLVGPTGDKKACLDYIQEHWTDMRPLSARSSGNKRSVTGG
jgi:MbtH protein